jgi:hypothetical protein
MSVGGNTAGRIRVRTNGSRCFAFLIFDGSLRILQNHSFLIAKPHNGSRWVDGMTGTVTHD